LKLVELTNTLVYSDEIVKISEGPSDLRRWFDRLNQLHKDAPRFEAEVTQMLERYVGNIPDDPEERSAVFEQIQIEFKRIIGPKMDMDFTIKWLGLPTAREFVRALYVEKEILEEIIRAFSAWKEKVRRGFRGHDHFYLKTLPIGISFNADTSIEVVGMRTLTLLTTPIRIAKKKTIPFPIERVRICPICKEFHWARRLDAETCGKDTCANTLGNKKRSQSKKRGIKNGDI